MKTTNLEFIRISNVIFDDKELQPYTKYLYGILEMVYNTSDKITIEELCEIGQATHNTINKHLTILKERGYITIKITKYGLKITPLIKKEMEIAHKEFKQKNEQVKKEINQTIELKRLESKIKDMEKNNEIKDKNNTPLCVLKFISRLK